MRKPSKRADPLRTEASRVGKSRRAQRDSRSLPSWYYRVLAFSYKGDREVVPCDFDEDLSELEDDKEQERDDVKQLNGEEEQEEEEDCECDGDDSECSCQFEDDNGVDDGSESDRSYDGSDADYYYELKEEREERKLEKLQQRREKERERERERIKEEEVCAAYRSLKGVPIDSLAGQEFKLFCSDHVDHFYSDLYPTKRVSFYRLDDEGNLRLDDEDNDPRQDKTKLGSETDMLYGDIYLGADANCGFGPFRPPKRASRKAVKVRSCDGTYELSFKFLGNGFLKLSVSREMVFMSRYSASPPAPPPTAPAVFEFVGIWRDLEKEEAERQETRDRSPRETWFEMNHPMGSWNY
ncbi:hypothetical protein C8A00DRAFT_42474 [Chaetomidium leptoderma]|uniref:Uncharacterized protein n=1 Tax=Chaetomidium leptoderma TaxID=669021 RepID=A0AAN6ZWQ4_9PEZI|nr:hypothetical protein C8A00DRAFT_42474 [Chaetomidium leptoderma]